MVKEIWMDLDSSVIRSVCWSDQADRDFRCTGDCHASIVAASAEAILSLRSGDAFVAVGVFLSCCGTERMAESG